MTLIPIRNNQGVQMPPTRRKKLIEVALLLEAINTASTREPFQSEPA